MSEIEIAVKSENETDIPKPKYYTKIIRFTCKHTVRNTDLILRHRKKQFLSTAQGLKKKQKSIESSRKKD